MTPISLMNSDESGVPLMPNATSLTETPSMMNAFSGDVVPAMETPYASPFAPGATSASDSNDLDAESLPPGVLSAMRLTKSWFSVTPVLLDPTSTVGALPTTTTSSALRPSGRSSAFTRIVASMRIVTPPREYGLYPSASSRRMYAPEGRFGMRYDPDLSVTTVCSPCMAGDVRVTTTSASGRLVAVSITVPVMTPE